MNRYYPRCAIDKDVFSKLLLFVLQISIYLLHRTDALISFNDDAGYRTHSMTNKIVVLGWYCVKGWILRIEYCSGNHANNTLTHRGIPRQASFLLRFLIGSNIELWYITLHDVVVNYKHLLGGSNAAEAFNYAIVPRERAIMERIWWANPPSASAAGWCSYGCHNEHDAAINVRCIWLWFMDTYNPVV